MFLSFSELIELTGLKQKAAQRRWLQREGFSFRVSAAGKPIVLKKAIEEILGAKNCQSATERTEPHWELMK